jgi:hypothetical protein
MNITHKQNRKSFFSLKWLVLPLVIIPFSLYKGIQEWVAVGVVAGGTILVAALYASMFIAVHLGIGCLFWPLIKKIIYRISFIVKQAQLEAEGDYIQRNESTN